MKACQKNACNKCNFIATDKEHLKMHVESCQKKAEVQKEKKHNDDEFQLVETKTRKKDNNIPSMINEVNIKKRKSENDNFPSGKKLK